jgi:hypothetical protein
MSKSKRRSTPRSKTSGSRKGKPLPRPSSKPLMTELDALSVAIERILLDGRDADGPLNQLQMAQAKASLQALNGAKVALKCPQLFGPYAAGSDE